MDDRVTWVDIAESPLAPALSHPEGHEVLGDVLALRKAQYRLALRIRRLDLSGGIYETGRGSLRDFARDHGLGAREAETLRLAGWLFTEMPATVERFLSGLLPFDHAALLGELVRDEGGLPEDRDWVEFAEASSTRTLSRAVGKRREERAQGAPVVSLPLRVTHGTLWKFERAQDLASRKAGHRLTRGETQGVLVDFYLSRNDPREYDRVRGKAAAKDRKARSRRPHSPGRPGPRGRASDYLPESVKRAVRARTGDRCAIDTCTNEIELEFAHIVPRALGGSNEADNILQLCRPQHRMFDAGLIRLVNTAAGHREFRDRKGRVIGRLRE